MKTILHKSLLAVACLLCSIGAMAYDFEYEGFYYNITSEAEQTVELTRYVTYSCGDVDGFKYSGSIDIPWRAIYNGKLYNVTAIGKETFWDCPDLTDVYIPTCITSIGDYAFALCSRLTEIEIPESVTSIGEWAFYKCTGLTEVTIPNSVTQIGNRAFGECFNLSQINIPSSVIKIGSEVFEGTPFYNNKADGLIYINNVLYKYKGAMPANTVIDIDEGTISIASQAFYQCGSLSKVTIPNSVKLIGSYAFALCNGLTDITMSDSIEVFEKYAFSTCSRLSEFTIPQSIKQIDEGTFYQCEGLTEVTIPDSIVSIGDWAFYWCKGLKEVVFGKNIQSIGDWAFSGCNFLKNIYAHTLVPPTIAENTFAAITYSTATLHTVNGLKSAYAEAPYWKNFTNITDDVAGVMGVSVNQATIRVANGQLYINGANDNVEVNIYGINGALLHHTTVAQATDMTLPRGIYLVQVGNTTQKVAI